MRTARRRSIRKLTFNDTNQMLDAVRHYAIADSVGDGEGGHDRLLLGRRHELQLCAAISRRSTPPCRSTARCRPSRCAYENAKAPILGLYGGNDERVDANIDTAKAELAKHDVDYEPHVFDGAGHGFLRQQKGSEQAPGNMKATEQAWPLVLAFLKKNLE